MVLAAGLGTRMGALTANKPKPLVEVLGRTLIDRVIDRLIQGGVTQIVVNVHYKADLMKAHLAKRKDVEIIVCDESDSILDTGGGVAKALPHFKGEPFFAQNSDSLWVEGMGQALARMRARFDPDKMDALMLLAACTSAIGYDGRGDFEMDPLGRYGMRLDGRWIHVGTPEGLVEAETFLRELATHP
jgi:MurNAc alpha-1-phosphate uridylyltransferase